MVLNKVSSLSAVAMTLMLGIAPLANADVLTHAQQEGQLTFGYILDEAPYSSMSATTGQPEGFAIELCEKVAQNITQQPAYADMKVVYLPTSIEDGFKQVENGDLDMLCGATVETLSRREHVSFSTPVSVGGLTAVINQNADAALKKVLAGEQAHTGPKWRATINRGLANHTYVVHQGTVTETWVRDQIKHLGVVANVITAKTHEEGVKLVSEGKADAYFADKAELVAQLHNSTFSNVQLTEHVYTTATERFALSKNDDQFRLAVDRALSEFYQSNEFLPMYTKYFGAPTEATLNQYQSYIIAE